MRGYRLRPTRGKQEGSYEVPDDFLAMKRWLEQARAVREGTQEADTPETDIAA